MNYMTDRWSLVLGALLHDVGKIGQRAKVPLSSEVRNVEHIICPSRAEGGYYSHRHVLWTAEFLSNISWLKRFSKAEHAAIYHHRSDDILSSIVAKADRLASGMERTQDEEGGANKTFREQRMRSIFSKVVVPGKMASATSVDPGGGEWTYPLRPLTFGCEEAFPTQSSEPTETDKGYKNLWDKLFSEVNNISFTRERDIINQLLTFLEIYTWCVPSYTQGDADISLYDHAKATAALALCIFDFLVEKGTYAPSSRTVSWTEDDSAFLLVAGDFSGIQEYIFSIRMGVGGVAKRLRARSFEVGYYTLWAALRILEEVDIPLTNLIMSAGGNFVLLLPNTQRVLGALKRVETELAEWSVKETHGRVQFALAYFEHTGKDLYATSNEEGKLPPFADTMRRLKQKLSEAKARPLAQVLLDGTGKWDAQIFPMDDPLARERDIASCQSCMRRVGKPVEIDNETIYLCEECEHHAQLGRKLPKYDAIVIDPRQTKIGRLQPRRAEDLSEETSGLCLWYGRKDFDRGLQIPCIIWRCGQFVPTDDEGEVLEFGELAHRSDDKASGDDNKGVPYIGCLKADVDNLGLIFQRGLTDMSLSRMMTLSRMLEIFFAGWLPAFLEKRCTEGKERIYIVYAGGDDSILIGRWDEILDIAHELDKKFREFVCQNPHIGWSAGFVLSQRKRPILHLVSWAEERLEKAKAGESKNAICVFDTVVPWQQYENVLCEAKNLAKWSTHIGSVPLYRLLKYARQAEDPVLLGGRVRAPFRWVMMLFYDLERNWRPDPQAAEAIWWIEKQFGLNSGSPRVNPTVNIALHYALYKKRKV